MIPDDLAGHGQPRYLSGGLACPLPGGLNPRADGIKGVLGHGLRGWRDRGLVDGELGRLGHLRLELGKAEFS